MEVLKMYEFGMFVENSVYGNVMARGAKSEMEYKLVFSTWYEHRLDADAHQVGNERFYVTDRCGRIVFEACA